MPEYDESQIHLIYMRENSNRNGKREAGFIAQELDTAQQDADADWFLIKAVQELSKELNQLKSLHI